MSRRRRLVAPGRITPAGMVVCALVATVSSATAAQGTAGHEAPTPDLEVRIAAQRLDDDRVEFALQFRVPAQTWSSRVPPELRFLPPDVEVGRWLVSSTLLVRNEDGATPGTTVELRIAAQRFSDDRVEFALQQREPGAAWGERLSPARRFFSMETDAGRWLVSSPLGADFPESAPVAPPSSGPAAGAPGDEPAGDDETGAVEVAEDLLDADMIDVQTGLTVNIRSLVDGETPLLFWLWSPY